jgi:hypothetical protein
MTAEIICSIAFGVVTVALMLVAMVQSHLQQGKKSISPSTPLPCDDRAANFVNSAG